jgi:hypothetical protein
MSAIQEDLFTVQEDQDTAQEDLNTAQDVLNTTHSLRHHSRKKLNMLYFGGVATRFIPHLAELGGVSAMVQDLNTMVQDCNTDLGGPLNRHESSI